MPPVKNHFHPGKKSLFSPVKVGLSKMKHAPPFERPQTLKIILLLLCAEKKRLGKKYVFLLVVSTTTSKTPKALYLCSRLSLRPRVRTCVPFQSSAKLFRKYVSLQSILSLDPFPPNDTMNLKSFLLKIFAMQHLATESVQLACFAT